MTKIPTELSIIIQNLKDGNLDDSLKKIKKIIITNSNKNLVCKLFASIYFQKKIGEMQSNIIKKCYLLKIKNLEYIIILV